MFRYRKFLAALVVGIIIVTMILSLTLYYARL